MPNPNKKMLAEKIAPALEMLAKDLSIQNKQRRNFQMWSLLSEDDQKYVEKKAEKLLKNRAQKDILVGLTKPESLSGLAVLLSDTTSSFDLATALSALDLKDLQLLEKVLAPIIKALPKARISKK